MRNILRNYKEKLENLYFHDSEITSIELISNEQFNRKCMVMIDYYNWEGNKENSGLWVWKKLKLTIDFIAHFEWNAPDFINQSFTIYDAEFDLSLDELEEKEKSKKKKYPGYKSPLFNDGVDYLSIKFMLNNFEEGIKSDEGYLYLIGSDITTEWMDEDKRIGQIHIPISG
ncbi:hypothetical protein SAMN06272722_10821 [Paenibacillus sp. RU5A]|nr:hypothetical protein SAMN06272722_10821 [Paenibacillus sp. RU5A]SOC72769.1 hypothetical protein SAMN05880581_10821 [Paenibacillus sp. RU26A]SOC75048.1 hypothetical protein SAMN05880586_10821 [Paenibacillus sp. RU5M]